MGLLQIGKAAIRRGYVDGRDVLLIFIEISVTQGNPFVQELLSGLCSIACVAS